MKKLLVIRNDKIGDFILIFPALALLKNSYPELHITALVPNYTKPLAELCPYIDDIILDAENKKNTSEFNRTLAQIKDKKFDAVISFVSDWHNAKLTWRSGIKYRLAPATKIFQFLYNQRLTQRRSQSAKAEFEYNLELAYKFLHDFNIKAVEPCLPYLPLELSAVQKQKAFLTEQLHLNPNKKWIFVHASTGGSANNLSLNQYAELIQGLRAHYDCQIVLTAGPNEAEKAQQLALLIQDNNVVIYAQNQGLADFTYSLACADLFIAGSTGPLHISGALNIPTIGFYPSRRSALPIRWRPINAVDKHLAFCPPTRKETQMDLTVINIAECLLSIMPFVRSVWKN